MNQGKRLARTTLLAVTGGAVLLVAANRLYGAVVTDGTPTWLKAALSLGLHTQAEPQSRASLSLAEARDFRRLVVIGRFQVQIVGAADYRVTATLPDGSPAPVHVGRSEEVLHLVGTGATSFGEPGSTMATLRIETPVLEDIHAQVVQLDIQGVRSDAVQLTAMGTGMTVHLRQNTVGQWQFVSGPPLEVRVDDATFAASTLNARGAVTIRRAE